MKRVIIVSFYSLVIVTVIFLLFVEWRGKNADAEKNNYSDVDFYEKILGINEKPPVKKVGKPHLIDAPLIMQLPELARGCEVTTLAMLLNQAGIHVNKMTLAKQIKKNPAPYRVVDGTVHFGDPEKGFVGNIYTYDEPGLGVYHGPIAALAERYLPNRVVDLTGKGFQAVEAQLDRGRPVWVIISTTYKKVPSAEWMTWDTPDGKVRVTRKEHAVLLTGYDKNAVYFNDPLVNEKNHAADKKDFIEAWRQFGGQAVTYR